MFFCDEDIQNVAEQERRSSLTPMRMNGMLFLIHILLMEGGCKKKNQCSGVSMRRNNKKNPKKTNSVLYRCYINAQSYDRLRNNEYTNVTMKNVTKWDIS